MTLKSQNEGTIAVVIVNEGENSINLLLDPSPVKCVFDNHFQGNYHQNRLTPSIILFLTLIISGITDRFPRNSFDYSSICHQSFFDTSRTAIPLRHMPNDPTCCPSKP
jgi:hypothetical protein